ncbi:MAG: tungstate ABC transporter substrate-binding protein WtpA [Bacteroidales bacterium]
MVILTGCGSTGGEKEIILFHAGSLSAPVKEIVQNYEALHPGVSVITQAAGSRASARKITDLNRPCDVFASADYSVIDNLLIPDYASWNIPFATNEMVIAYRDESRFADSISRENWPEILSSPEVIYGRSNPDHDPCGYRTVITIRLAGKCLRSPEWAESLLQKDKNFIRPKETDLIALLETGSVDYFFIYRSVAQQHHLNWLILPDSINLKNPNLTDFYSQATVEVSGKKPGETIIKRGEPMIYGITVPTTAPHPELAIDFVRYWLSSEGGAKILEEMGQPSVIPSPTETFSRVPRELKSFVLPAN